MTFGAAGDTTVVRTFPYGVPEGADSLVRLSFGADDTVRHVPGRLLPTDSLPEPFSPVLPADTVSAFMDPSVSFPLPVLRSLAAYPLLSVSGIRC